MSKDTSWEHAILTLVKAKGAKLRSQAKVELQGEARTNIIECIINALLLIVNLFAWLLSEHTSMGIQSDVADSTAQD